MTITDFTDERRAKVAALTHELMDLIVVSDKAYGVLEEWHDHYRWLDGTDVCDRLDYRIEYVQIDA